MISTIDLVVEPHGVAAGVLGEVMSPPPLSSWADVGMSEALSPLTVGIVGLGYVGLPTALGLVEAGVRVLGCDVSETRLAAIKAGSVDLLAADHDRLERVLGTEKLVLTTEPRVLAAANLVMICVPTPVDEHLVPDLTALRDACQSAVKYAVAAQTIVLTSTTYVGCTRDLLAVPLRKRGFTVGEDIFVAFSPERIDPGNAANVPARTPRVVGGVTPECARQATKVLGRTAPVLHAVSSPEAAEMTKLLENTFRAVNIALANEFSSLARELDIDPIEVIGAAATKPYGFMPFYPGPGAGGHCIPCDPHYLLWQLKAQRIAAPVITAAMDAIAARPRAVVARAQQILAEHGRPLTGSRVLVLGVTYKPGVADVRESPALEILNGLAAAGAKVAYSDSMIEALRTATGTLVGEHRGQVGTEQRVGVGTGAPMVVPLPNSAAVSIGHSGVRRRSAFDLEVIIPAFNEVDRLPLALRRTVEFLATQPWRSRVVVVDNGSVDDTTGAVWEFVDGFTGAVPVEVVGCARPGKGAAVRRGLLSSTSRFVGFFDADLATPVETLTAAMDHLQQGTTAVIASRHVTGASFVRPQPLVRRTGGAAFRVLARTLVRGVRDTQCGFKFFERDAVMRALVQCQTTGFAFDVELLRRIQRDGGSIVEIPVAWTDGTQSTFRPVRDGLASFGAVLQMHSYQS